MSGIETHEGDEGAERGGALAADGVEYRFTPVSVEWHLDPAVEQRIRAIVREEITAGQAAADQRVARLIVASNMRAPEAVRLQVFAMDTLIADGASAEADGFRPYLDKFVRSPSRNHDDGGDWLKPQRDDFSAALAEFDRG